MVVFRQEYIFMKENRITGKNSKGEKEMHVLLESETDNETGIMSSLDFINLLTNRLHCLDFSLSKNENNVSLEVKKITYEEEIDYINKLIAHLVEKKLQNKPKIDITAP